MIETYKEEALFIAKRVEDEAHSSSSIKAARTIRMLLTMLESASLDAARIDWLIGQDNCVVAEGLNGFWLSWIDEHDQRRTKYQDGSYPSARAAIDAAMAATKGEQA